MNEIPQLSWLLISIGIATVMVILWLFFLTRILSSIAKRKWRISYLLSFFAPLFGFATYWQLIETKDPKLIEQAKKCRKVAIYGVVFYIIIFILMVFLLILLIWPKLRS